MKRYLCFSVALILVARQSAFALLAEVRSGPVNTSYGGVNPARSDRSGALINSEGHAKFQEPVLQGNVYTCTNPQATPVTTQAGLSATTPVLVLYNPAGSGKNIVLIEDTIGLAAAPVAASVFSMAVFQGAPTATTVGNTFANLISVVTSLGTANPSGQCYRISTLASAPTAIRYIGQVTGAATLTPPVFADVVDGKIILQPGSGVTFQTTTAASIVGSFTWEEVAQ